MAGSPLPRILLVDDDTANLRTFQRVFRGQYEVEVAASGEAALRLLQSSHFDVALVDYLMPGMSGLELLRVMERLHPRVARLMLTAHADLPELAALTGSGVVLAVLMKPWDRIDVEHAVTRALQLAPGSRHAPKPDPAS